MSNVTERLESIGISVDPYKRGPAGKDIFAISIQGAHLRIWEGVAQIAVSTNKRKRQAVITVTENPRTVKTSGSLYYGQVLSNVKNDELEDNVLEHFSLGDIRSSARIQVPNSRMKILNIKKDHAGDQTHRVIFDLEFRTKTTKTSFLVGFDTHAGRPFVSQLKNVVNTVEEAHRELLPVNTTLKDGHKRQGEWFFNPVSQKNATKLNENIHKARYIPIDEDTTHRGLVLSHNRKSYVIGTIVDRRKDRHKPLVLSGWHEVIRNNEVAIQTTSTTWD